MTQRIDKYYTLELDNPLPVAPEDTMAISTMSVDDKNAFNRMVRRFFMQRPHLFQDPDWIFNKCGKDSDKVPFTDFHVGRIYLAKDVPDFTRLTYHFCGNCAGELEDEFTSCCYCGSETILEKEHENVKD